MPSSCPGQGNCPTGQVSFHFHSLDDEGLNASRLPPKSKNISILRLA